jgi:hypothetical protein
VQKRVIGSYTQTSMRNLRRLLWALVGLWGLICLAFLFLLGGGVHWLDKDVFPPRRPSFMPANSVWIDAPPLPLSWHNGWWFGCGVSPSETANYCRLVSDGQTVYGGDYVSCRTLAAVPEHALKLIPPPQGTNMWLGGENAGVAGYTKDGDVLLPVAAIQKCDAVSVRGIGQP